MSDAKRYIGICLLCGKLAETEDECEWCGSNTVVIDAVILADDRDIKALQDELSAAQDELVECGILPVNHRQVIAEQAKTIERLEEKSRTPREGDEQYFNEFDDLVRQVIRPSVERFGGDFESLYDGSGTESGDERDFLAAAIGQCVGFLDDCLAEQVKTIERLRKLLGETGNRELCWCGMAEWRGVRHHTAACRAMQRHCRNIDNELKKTP